MTISRNITIKSAGKINLYLNVSKKLRPDGYHEIKSIMQSVSLSDELTFYVSHNFGLQHPDNGKNLPISNLNSGRLRNHNSENRLDGTGGNGINISCNNIDIPLNEKNLVHKAAFLILNRFNLNKKYRIDINIKKSIPVSAGLAGGSTNAAATLVALNRIFGLKLSEDELKILGNEVGSDVPFCISGGTALVEGKGELISKLPDMPFYWVVLAINGKKFSSGDVYDRFDLIGKEKTSKHSTLVENLIQKNYKMFFSNLDNDLEKVVTYEDAMVNTLKNTARELGSFASQMTGSGPAIFAFCNDLQSARRVYSGLEKITDKVFLSYTTPDSQSFLN
ncbi:MAG: 4-(cytidine 5'-diphospho)-2-C-methyl-D-erythritol kinase [Actinobacteria bacterium]|nr:4-(cytidine 5'-diphospho)-2-C-methyl-D-erythritol kinase [Actinomycetota bacterium]